MDQKVSTEYDSSIIEWSSALKTFKTLRESVRIALEIEKGLSCYFQVAIPVVVNSLTIMIKHYHFREDNNNLIVMPRGFGKSKLLYHILAKSNPKFVYSVEDKIYETEILRYPDETFKQKVWVIDDLITTFRGTNTKQREQLMGFFNSFLTKGCYQRRGIKVEGRIVCMFGLATENYLKYHKEMFLSTFLDRLIPIKYTFNQEEIDKILDEEDKLGIPCVRLPFKKRLAKITLSNKFKDEIKKIAKRLHVLANYSPIRAKHYVENFLMANTYLNKRKDVCYDDLRLFKLIETLHYEIEPNILESKILLFILEESSRSSNPTGRDIKNRFKDFSETRISSILSKLREFERIGYKKVSLKRGYDYEYWI